MQCRAQPYRVQKKPLTPSFGTRVLLQGAYTPGPGPNQPAAEQAGTGRKFRKPDGFHSSASDKVLQER